MALARLGYIICGAGFSAMRSAGCTMPIRGVTFSFTIVFPLFCLFLLLTPRLPPETIQNSSKKSPASLRGIPEDGKIPDKAPKRAWARAETAASPPSAEAYETLGTAPRPFRDFVWYFAILGNSRKT